MFFIPMAIFVGHPQITVALYLWKGILPVLLGNILGGSVFCGAYHHLMYAAGSSKSPDGKRSTDLESGLSPQRPSKDRIVSSVMSSSDGELIQKDK